MCQTETLQMSIFDLFVINSALFVSVVCGESE